MIRRVLTSLRASLFRHRALLLVTLAAIVVRLVWNLAVHNPVDFAYSDMGGYLARGEEMLTRPWMPPKGPLPHLRFGEITDWLAPRLFGPKSPYLTLYPYGTHVFVAGVKAIFGLKNRVAIGSSFAVLGALAVGFSYATAARFSPRPRVRRAVAAILIFYYPWISLGGYALSETPFTTALAGLAFYTLRLADEGRRGDGWRFGIWLALAAAVRPQVLVSVPLLGLLFLVRRRTFHNFTWGLVPRAAAPLAILLALSAWRVHWHLGTPVDADHLISTNGPMNRIFARCHNTGLNAVARDGKGFFGPPSLGSLLQYEKDHPHPLFSLDPVMGPSITFNGHMWDAAPTNKVAGDCVKKTGWLRQAKFAVTHVVLLWGYNIIWPDMGNKLQFRIPMTVFCVAHAILIMPPAVLAMVLAFRRRRARAMLLALQVWALFITSMLYFGDTRYRAPYDGILTVLAIAMVPELRGWLRIGWERLRHRRPRRPMPALTPAPASP